MMEHRIHSRKPVDWEVELLKKGRVVATAHAIDICPEGLGIENPGITLQRGQVVMVNLHKPGDPPGEGYRTHALVIHTGPDLLGLMLADDPLG